MVTSVVDVVRGLARSDQRADRVAWGLCVVFVLTLGAIVAHDLALPGKALFTHAGEDFHAFYCAGQAASHGDDPYLVEPLRTCEAQGANSNDAASGLVDPAPLPGYAIALFAALSHVPYPVAKAMWLVALVGSVFVATWYIARVTGLPALLVLSTMSLTDGYINAIYGQLPPLVTACVAATAFCIDRRKWVLAAAFGAATMLEPHVGVAVCASLVLFFPRTRPTVALAAIVLALASLATLDAATNATYFTRVLPAQAAAELIAVDQWSLAHVLHLLGVSNASALHAGTLSYLTMLVVGLSLARRVGRTLEAPSLVVAIPPAAVLIGGVYMHEMQLALALPAAFVLASRARRFRTVASVALMLLAFPWFSLDASHALLTATAAAIAIPTCLWIARTTIETRVPWQRIARSCAIAFGFALLLTGFARVPGPSHLAPDGLAPAISGRYRSGDALASDNWAANLRVHPARSASTARKELEKVPSWIALTIVMAVAFGQGPVGRRVRFARPVAA